MNLVYGCTLHQQIIKANFRLERYDVSQFISTLLYLFLAEGSFQSDALLVPEGCLFDHIHNQSRCWEFDRWNITSEHACGARRMTLKSFAMLLPCGIDVFSGVEFVCCPKNYKTHGKARPMEVEEPVALPQMDRHAHQSLSPPTPTPTPRVPITTTPQVNTLLR